VKIKKIIYVGIFLDEEEQEKAKTLMRSGVLENPPSRGISLLENVKCDHLTLVFKPTEEELAALPIGEEASIVVRGRAATLEIQALRCEVDLPCKNENPHITVSHAEGVSPAKSNELLQRGYECLPDTVLTGRVGAFTYKGTLFSLQEEEKIPYPNDPINW